MTAYALPSWFKPSRFELRLMPNTRVFVGPYTPTTQVIDLLGERWMARVDLPPDTDPIIGAAREAFFDRLKGPLNQITMPHMRIKAPQGTLRGSPTLKANVAQLGQLAALTNVEAGATLKAGDMLGINGQLVRVMADATTNANGDLPFYFQGRARTAWSAGTPVVWNAPTANFMLKSADGVPTVWNPGSVVDASSFELIEVW